MTVVKIKKSKRYKNVCHKKKLKDYKKCLYATQLENKINHLVDLL